MLNIPNMNNEDLALYFGNCAFIHPGNNKVAVLELVGRVTCQISMYETNDLAAEPVGADIPTKVLLANINAFALPEHLGWRATDDGKILVHGRYEAKGGGKRGLGNGTIGLWTPQIMMDLASNSGTFMGNLFRKPGPQYALFRQNNFIPFKDGLESVLAGERLSFAVNPTIAVHVSGEADCDALPVVVRIDRKLVAKIGMDRKIVSMHGHEMLVDKALKEAA